MTTLLLQVDFKAGKPVYLQLTDQVRYAAASGLIRPGEPLPSIRDLAEELRINRNTVAKAYDELESIGVIESLPGKGCFLKQTDSQLTRQARHKVLADAIDEALVTAHQLQVNRDAFMALVGERAEFFEQRKNDGEKAK
jgi:GntR family transcriptional regulator